MQKSKILSKTHWPLCYGLPSERRKIFQGGLVNQFHEIKMIGQEKDLNSSMVNS